MQFKVSCLIGHYRISRRMALIESILGEADHIVEYFLSRRFRYAVSHASCDLHVAFFIRLAVNEILFFFQHDAHLFLGHGSAHKIRTAVTVAAQVSDYLHYLFLIYETAVSYIEYRRQSRVNVFYLIRVLFVLYIFRYGIHRSRSVQRNSGHYIFKTAGTQIFHELGHSLAFKLEHSLSIALRDHFIYSRIIVAHPGEIYLHSVVFSDQFQCVSYDR